MYAEPSVLVLDEATSALDTKTESAVTGAIRSLGEDVTTITIAHRLATIQHCDVVFYMSEGTVAAAGTFDEVIEAVPAFAEQAALAGLTGGEQPLRHEPDQLGQGRPPRNQQEEPCWPRCSSTPRTPCGAGTPAPACARRRCATPSRTAATRSTRSPGTAPSVPSPCAGCAGTCAAGWRSTSPRSEEHT